MKTDILKKLIKEAVREAIQEELKDILLEAVKGNKQPIKESYSDDRTISFNSNNLSLKSTSSKFVMFLFEILRTLYRIESNSVTTILFVEYLLVKSILILFLFS